jgi:TonB family protein
MQMTSNESLMVLVCPPASDEASAVQADGTVIYIEVVKSSNVPSFDEKAVETLRQWRFKPAMDRDGNPVPYATSVEVTFHLK